jgi:UDP-glucuronate 4-epimerase
MPHALVTGGAGFIGSHLVDRLLGEGWTVTVIDNFDPFYDPEIKRGNISAHLDHPSYALMEGDIRNISFLNDCLRRRSYDAIVHLAAKAGVRPSIQDPAAYYDVNVRGTQNLLTAAREAGVEQFVFASSSSVYGVNPNVPWREDGHALLPISPYASTKVSGELMGHVYSHLHNIRFIALRFFTVYGPRQRPDLAIHKFTNQILNGQPVPLFGDGTSLRDYTYVSDIVDAIVAGMSYNGSKYEVINVGGDHPITLLDLVNELERALGLTAKVYWQQQQAGDVFQTWADISKAGRLLGYRPRIELASGLRRFADSIVHQYAA